MEIISTDYDRPLVFRTVDSIIYRKSIDQGSMWLRSSYYYRRIEDEARKDTSEGINGTASLLPLFFQAKNGVSIKVCGPGSVGCEIIDHYIVSLHGPSISQSTRREFGGYTSNLRMQIAAICY